MSEGAEDGRSVGKKALRVVGGADPYGWGAEASVLTEGRRKEDVRVVGGADPYR